MRSSLVLLMGVEEEDVVALAPFTRGRKTTSDTSGSPSSSTSRVDSVLRGVEDFETAASFDFKDLLRAVRRLEELPDGPAGLSSSSL